MDNNRFPEPEENGILHQEPEAIPVLEDIPVMEELTFRDDEPVIEEIPFEPLAPEPLFPEREPVPAPEEPSADEEAPVPEDIPAPEEAPVFEDIPISEDIPVPEEEPTPEVFSQDDTTPEEAPPLPQPEPVPNEEPSCEEPLPQEDAPIPDAKTRLEEAAEKLMAVEVRQELLPDTSAMDANGLLGHGELEPAFDMSILDDPDLQLPGDPDPAQELQEQQYRDDSKEFDTLLNAPVREEKPAPPPRKAPKGRPKRKKGEGLLGIPNILATFVWLALIVMIGVTAGRMLWVCAADVLAFGREDKVVTVTVYEADTMEQITEKLHEKGLIRYKSLFMLYADISDAREDIQAGIYDLNTRYDYHALVNFMSPRSSREVITLTIPEGYTCRQIFALLEENRICTAVDIAAYAANGELNDYWFLEGVERGSETCLEGYLFPDTYEFYKNSTPREALQRMLNNFEIKFDQEMQDKITALNDRFGSDYTVREITIVASLIEKESAAPEESPKVSGVIYNRLFNWGTNPAYLNIDASIVYALDGKSALTREDLQMDHPYNTYTNTGLTPGPIANPGLSSLKAALEPETHNYYYYVLNPSTGMHQFSTTYEEHSAYVEQFSEAE